MSEWLGCDKPLKLDANVSAAADWIDEILKKQFFAESINEEEVKAAWKEIAGPPLGPTARGGPPSPPRRDGSPMAAVPNCA